MSSPCVNSMTKLYSHFNEFRIEEKFYDVIVIVGDRKFPCHRIILASALKYFRSMFSGGFNEAGKNEVELKFIAADDFEVLLTHIYGGSVSFTGDRAYRLLKISEYLCVPSLVNLCVKYLAENAETVSLETAINVFAFASMTCNLTRLADLFVERLAENFANISRSRKLVCVPGSGLLKILGHPDLKKDSDAILSFLGKWTNYHRADRDRKLLPILLQTAKLEKVPNEWLLKSLTGQMTVAHSTNGDLKKDENESDKVEGLPCNNPGVSVEEELVNDVMDEDIKSLEEDEMKLPCEAVMYVRCGGTIVNLYGKLKQSNTVKRTNFENYSYRSRVDNSIIVNCKSVFIEKIQFTTLCEKCPGVLYYRPYICRKFRWDQELPYKSFKCYADFSSGAITSHGTNIFFYRNRNFDMFNCQTNQWVIGALQEEDSTGFVATEKSNLVSDGYCMYLVGGKHTSPTKAKNIVKTCALNGRYFQRYDLRSGTWSQLPQLTYARSRAASCIHKNVIYVSGGEDLMYRTGHIECYDLTAGKWRTLDTSMPEPKMNHTVRVYDDQLWFYGGKKFDSDMKMVNDLTWYSYNLKEKTWSDVVSLSIDDCIYGQPEEILDVVVTEG